MDLANYFFYLLDYEIQTKNIAACFVESSLVV